jgi:hypothetical protein
VHPSQHCRAGALGMCLRAAGKQQVNSKEQLHDAFNTVNQLAQRMLLGSASDDQPTGKDCWTSSHSLLLLIPKH